MAEQHVQRRLAAILAADVAGYSRLMGEDEEGTLAVLTAHLTESIEPCIAEHRGRVVKTTGDGLLAEFASVVDAVRCAVSFQESMAERNADVPQDRRIEFRIGVNLGDVIVQDQDVYGDGVNVAARLEGLAEPGGVVVSGSVHEQVKGKIVFAFDDLGRREVKNIAAPVHAYRLAIKSAHEPPKTDAVFSLPSLAVLPFENMSGDPEQEYFSDGIAEDLITALSRLRQFRVVARNSTFSYKGQAPDVRDVAKDLGVRYVIEGSIRKAGNRVRISCQLIDGLSGNHIWAKRYDRELEDIFAVQDELTETIAAAIQPELGKAEIERAKAKRPDSLDAWDTLLRGISAMYRGRKEDLKEARELFRHALEIDENLAAAYAWLSETHYFEVLGGYVPDPEEHMREATTAARKAVQLDSEDPASRVALSRARLRGDPQTAIEDCRRAIELNSAHAEAHHTLGRALIWAGRADEAVDAVEVAIRLSPRDMAIGRFMARLAEAKLCLGNLEEAIEWGRKSIREPGIQYWAYTYPISAMGHLDRLEEARPLIGELLAWKPEFTCEFAHGQYATHGYREHFVDGLRKAGVPE